MHFEPFDPLEFKNTKISEAAINALKREITNILSSYVGWYDPFCELIQNSLDSVEARTCLEKQLGEKENYQPKINIIINLDDNSLTVSDNGIGLDKEKFEQFLAPNFSFKSGNTRGHKGVGATYVAYGFNYLSIYTKTGIFSANGTLLNARRWLHNQSSPNSPKVEPSTKNPKDLEFLDFDKGVSITVKFDSETHPKKLGWLGAKNSDQWAKILKIKTGIGAIVENKDITIKITTISNSEITNTLIEGTGYPWLHNQAAKKATLSEVRKQQEELFKKFGPARQMPDKYRNLDFIYDDYDHEKIREIIKNNLDEDDEEILNKYTPKIKFEYGYTAKLWTQFNKELKVRNKVLSSGIQLAANNMPQGETILVPLHRNIGRQHQVHILIHFDNYSPDMGRKGFHRELTDFSSKVSRIIVEEEVAKYRHLLKANTGTAPDITRSLKISEWKEEITEHEKANPLNLEHKNFFIPIEKISITSKPTREQDVIALFHQLVAGGVIRGIQTMSTNERFIYDGLYKIDFRHPVDVYLYEESNNPLGITKDIIDELHGKVTPPRILEYKFSLDGLLEDLDSNDKNIKDIDLCVAWESGNNFKQKFGITSLLIPENTSQREYHGVTHHLIDHENGNKICDLILLCDLINSLNNPKEADNQRYLYD